MNLQTILNNKKMTKYHLSKISGVPKTTVIDICSGKSSLQKCSAKTVYQLAKALDMTMEDLMLLEDSGYDSKTGLPNDKSYMECGLPPYLQHSLDNMIKSWEMEDSGVKDYHWDIAWSELNADINSAEIEQEISSERAWYLREKYLGMKKEMDF